MEQSIFDTVKSLCTSYDAIKLAYLYGSQAHGDTGPLSDYDFAFYVEVNDKSKRFELRLQLINELCKLLNTNAIDVVILNDVESPELKFHIIRDGKLLYEQEPFKVLMEPRILSEYFDFYQSLAKHGLTKA